MTGRSVGARRELAPSPLQTVNRALAVAEKRGPVAGLAVLDGLTAPAWLARAYG